MIDRHGEKKLKKNNWLRKKKFNRLSCLRSKASEPKGAPAASIN
jgi:hypothetical protein